MLFQLLTGHGPELASPVIAVRVRGARIVGRLNLGGMQLQCPLELYECHLYRLGLAKAKAPNISLRGSYLQSGLSGRYLRVEHTLNLSGRFRCDGRVVLRNANIGGDLACSGATLSHHQGDALFAHGLAVDANAFLLETKVTGRVWLDGAHIGGQLNCTGATISNEQGQALYANRLIVDGNMILSKAEVTGSVWLAGAHIGGQLNCTWATFSNGREEALQADNLVVKKDMALNDAKITGEVRLLHARIGGDLACRGATFSNRRWKALSADGLIADRNVYLDKGEVAGEVRLPAAHISGDLSCSEGTFSNEQGQALYADRLIVDGNMILSEAKVTGQIRLYDAQIGLLGCHGATLSNDQEEALLADRLIVDRNMVLSKADVTGQVRLVGAQIGGDLICIESNFRNNPEDTALDLERASVMHAVFLRPASLRGSLNLTHSHVSVWYDDKRTWPTRMRLEGFAYDAMDPQITTVKDRLVWLRRNEDGYAPQPYEQLARFYRLHGNEQAAWKVAISKQRARRAHVRGWRRWPSRGWSALLRWTVGYGYRPALALIPFTILLITGSVLFDAAYPADLRPAKTGIEQPEFNSFRYTLDLLLPVANFKQRDAFVPHAYAAWLSLGFTFAGWLLALAVVAGLAGVFKRD